MRSSCVDAPPNGSARAALCEASRLSRVFSGTRAAVERPAMFPAHAHSPRVRVGWNPPGTPEPGNTGENRPAPGSRVLNPVSPESGAWSVLGRRRPREHGKVGKNVGEIEVNWCIRS